MAEHVLFLIVNVSHRIGFDSAEARFAAGRRRRVSTAPTARPEDRGHHERPGRTSTFATPFMLSTHPAQPYTMALQSQHITVAGLLLFRFHLLCPPHAVQIYSIKVKINQKVVLHSAIEEGFTIAVPPDPRTVFRLDAVHPPNSGHIVVATSSATSRSGSQTPHLGPLRTVERDEDWKFMHLARVPNDNSLRPSTQEGSQTGIVIQHDIYVELQYRVVKEDEGSEKSSAILLKGKEREREREEKLTLVVSKPLDLHSVRIPSFHRVLTAVQCCCFLDSLTLPVYSLEDPHPTPDISPPCICSMELSRLIELQGDTLMREEGEMGITYATVQKYSEDSSRGGSGASTPVTTPTGMPSARGREGRLGLGSGWEGVLRNALLE